MGANPIPPLPSGLSQSIANGIAQLEDVVKSTYTATLEMEKRMGVGAPWNIPIGLLTAFIGIILYVLIALLIAILLPIAVPLITLFMSQLLTIRKDTPEAQLELSAASLSEFLGVEIDPAHLKTGKSVKDSLEVTRLLGDALYNRLYAEFGLKDKVTPGPGETAARTFSGFAVNFATQNAMISTLADAISFHELEQFRELGVETAKNLGLGRLQRMALGTLLDNVIRKPYTRELAARLHPDRLSVPEYIHARNRGDISEDDLQTALLEHGYRPADIKAVINEYTDKLSISELTTLVRYGKLNQDAAVTMLQAQGLDSTTAAMRLQASQLAILNDNVKAYVDALNQAVRNRTIDSDTWSSLMNQVPWTDDEKQWTKLANGAYLDFYQKQLTWTQVVTAFEQGIVDVDYVEAWLISKGYSPDDITNMELLLAVKFDEFAAKAASKGKTPKPPPTPKPAP